MFRSFLWNKISFYEIMVAFINRLHERTVRKSNNAYMQDWMKIRSNTKLTLCQPNSKPNLTHSNLR